MLHYRLVLSHSGIKHRLLKIIHSFAVAHASHQRRIAAQRRSISENRPLRASGGECTFAGFPLRRLLTVETLPLLQAPRQDH
ncbi:hypothetical protein BDZ89DRAFT_1065836 [Hymenopellis radicata]|nr:hypothetical protein BDZ89DRAFT_1065836 [Hymenopellis radicata]